MKQSGFKSGFAIAVVAVVGILSAARLGATMGAERTLLGESATKTLFSAEKIKGALLGLDGLIADIYWMRSLQYIGAKIVAAGTEVNIDDLRGLEANELHPLLDASTTLDPHFLAPYSYGAVVLPAIDPQKAVELAEKGIRNNPGEWRLYQHLGFIHWRLGRFAEAAATYRRGSVIDGAPPFMGLMAARLSDEGGSRAVARQMYLDVINNTSDVQIKSIASRRILEIDRSEGGR